MIYRYYIVASTYIPNELRGNTKQIRLTSIGPTYKCSIFITNVRRSSSDRQRHSCHVNFVTRNVNEQLADAFPIGRNFYVLPNTVSWNGILRN